VSNQGRIHLKIGESSPETMKGAPSLRFAFDFPQSEFFHYSAESCRITGGFQWPLTHHFPKLLPSSKPLPFIFTWSSATFSNTTERWGNSI
jgi:hypothetical protein